MAILKVKDANGNVTEIPAIRGKSAYAYAKDGGYTGTEVEFAAKLAEVYSSESWEFTLEDGSTVTKKVVLA